MLYNDQNEVICEIQKLRLIQQVGTGGVTQ